MKLTTKKLVIAALLIAISFVGSYLKIFGTIALDSLPAFLGGLILGPVIGGLIGFIGHMLTSLTSGFPFGLPVHLVIAIGMFLTVSIFALVCKKAPLWVGGLVAVILNSPVTLLLVSPFLGKEVAMTLIVPLSIVSFVNVLLGIVIFLILKNRKVLETDTYV